VRLVLVTLALVALILVATLVALARAAPVPLIVLAVAVGTALLGSLAVALVTGLRVALRRVRVGPVPVTAVGLLRLVPGALVPAGGLVVRAVGAVASVATTAGRAR